MSIFAWQAVDIAGRRKRGEIESDSERSARKKLKQQGLIVRQLTLLKDQKGRASNNKKQGLSSVETTLFLQQLSVLTSAGMTLSEALSSVAEGMEKNSFRTTFRIIRKPPTNESGITFCYFISVDYFMFWHAGHDYFINVGCTTDCFSL